MRQDEPDSITTRAMMTSRNLLNALIASAVVSVPFGLASMTIMSGSWLDTVTHPGFWMFYGESFLWFFAATILASALTLVLISKKKSQVS